ncbi:MAG TPA: YbdK family carboxylate-amine ligase [Solirubrobacterales bacterium]|nr:YbdK family carboxylate-amine ligase [Solirubrobacterales bacterium]
MLEHKFNGTAFTVGIEEELMLLDPDSLDLAHGIGAVLPAIPADYEGQVKTELFQSVLEIATLPCADLAEAGEQLRELRSMVASVAADHGMLLGAAGTHPFALCDDQRIVEKERYLELADELGFIAERELIFGTHVHIGLDAPDKAIYVADGIRRYLPLMLALSANSPFWEGRDTGMQSARTPVFRAFPRVGVPPHYGTWEIFSGRVEQMTRSGAIDDYTYLWWDVRPHPNLGTVETRIFDQANSLDDTLAFAALTQSLAHRLSRIYANGEPLFEVFWEIIDDNKVRAALRGLEGRLLDLSEGAHVPATELAARLLDELRPSAVELGCEAQLERIAGIAEGGTGATRQLALAAELDGDLRELVRRAVVIGA